MPILLRMHGPAIGCLLLAAMGAACGPAADDTNATFGTNTGVVFTTTTDAVPTTEPGEDTASDTGDPLDGFNCEGARWFTVVTDGQMNAVGLDSRGHTIGFGSQARPGADPEDALIVDLDPAGVVVKKYQSSTSYQDWVTLGGVDGEGNLYAIFSTGVLKKLSVGGEEVAEVELEGEGQIDDPYALSVAANGVLTIGDANGITRRGPDLAVEWQRSSDVNVQATNSAGAIVGTRLPGNKLVLLDPSGSIVWERAWDSFGNPCLDLSETGETVATSRDIDDRLLIARFGPDGAPIWDTRFRILDKFDAITGVAINEDGKVAATGYVQADGGLLGFVVRLDADGDIVAQHACTPGKQILPSAIALDDAGNLRIAGELHSDRVIYSFIAAF